VYDPGNGFEDTAALDDKTSCVNECVDEARNAYLLAVFVKLLDPLLFGEYGDQRVE